MPRLKETWKYKELVDAFDSRTQQWYRFSHLALPVLILLFVICALSLTFTYVF
jgi:hypothetical protein